MRQKKDNNYQMLLYLSCENLDVKIDNKPLISEFNLTLSAASSYSITGPNGIGKTSLLKVLAGLAKPSAGLITTFSQNTQTNSQKIPILFLANSPSLLLDQSVKWNLDFYTQSYGLFFTATDYDFALEQVGLIDRKEQATRSLSTGQKRRLTLAALLLIKPKVILADEPTNGLDDHGIQLCLDIFSALQNEYKSALVAATHDEKLIRWTQQEINLSQYIPKRIKNTKSDIKVLL